MIAVVIVDEAVVIGLQQLRYQLSWVDCFRYQKQCLSHSAGNLDSLGGIGCQN
jgi:hypothetical protein|tara:strand:- start:1499 stop:1657 length:159 start_codon:yes stop_codon:yes gene_type:complete